jgi:hypothetical protein
VNESGTYRRYYCRYTHHCPEPAAIKADAVEQWAVSHLFAALAPGGVLLVGMGDVADSLDQARGAVAAAEQEVAFWLDLENASALGRADFLAGYTARETRLHEAREHLAGLIARSNGLPEYATLEADWPTLTTAERRLLLSVAMDAVFVRKGAGGPDERSVILWRGEGPSELPRRGKSLHLPPYRW